MPRPVVCPHCQEELEIPAELRGRPRDEFYGYEPLAVKLDNDRKNAPGYRFAEYELRGGPERVEIG